MCFKDTASNMPFPLVELKNMLYIKTRRLALWWDHNIDDYSEHSSLFCSQLDDRCDFCDFSFLLVYEGKTYIPNKQGETNSE